ASTLQARQAEHPDARAEQAGPHAPAQHLEELLQGHRDRRHRARDAAQERRPEGLRQGGLEGPHPPQQGLPQDQPPRQGAGRRGLRSFL
ncbi:MAG: SSU ribosomal protein S20p, partial [uncultured Rubrobacteraceae bacterium]